MTEKQGCTFCGADGHLAAQCQWAPAIAADIYAKLSSYGALRTSVDNILDVMEAIREVELGHRAYVSADEALVNAEYDLSFARCSNDLPTAKRNVRNAQMSLIALRSLIQCDRPHSLLAAVDVAENRFEAPVAGWGDPVPPEPPVECPHRCGSVYVKESYGAGFIEGSGMCPACDAAMPPKDITRTVQVCKLGNCGKAYDSPEARRAYSYTDQPGNLEALKLGAACISASMAAAGDGIDRGLLLLRELEGKGFGVFELENAPGSNGTIPPTGEA